MDQFLQDLAASQEERDMLAAVHAEFVRQGHDPELALDLVADAQRKLRLRAEAARVDGDGPEAPPG